MPTGKLTPTQDLIMDQMAARTRLGEPFWPFDRRLGKALAGLSEQGLVTVSTAGPNLRVRLTKAGTKLIHEGSNYVSPLEKELAKALGQLKEIRGLRALEVEHRSGLTW